MASVDVVNKKEKITHKIQPKSSSYVKIDSKMTKNTIKERNRAAIKSLTPPNYYSPKQRTEEFWRKWTCPNRRRAKI